MRNAIIAGNWKMHGTRASVQTLLEDIKTATFPANVELVVFPSFVFLEQTERLLKDSSIHWGAQNANAAAEGAFTGEVSLAMLKEFGCKYVLIGHSERRTLFGETNEVVAKKFLASHQTGLIPMVCVGESLQERKINKTFEIITKQLESLDIKEPCVIAYEPVWAIGTGLTATAEQVQEVHQFIRAWVGKKDKKTAEQLRILYGGSVKPDNAAALFQMPDVDGGLIGGASLQPQSFLAIANSWKA